LIEAATARGVAVPGELAVAGINDMDVCRISKPMISTLRIDAYGIGKAAAGEIVSMLGGGTGCDHLIPTTLVARGSSVPGWEPYWTAVDSSRGSSGQNINNANTLDTTTTTHTLAIHPRGH